MSPERRQKVDQIYRTALERVPAARDAYVAEACQGDELLTSEVKFKLESRPVWELPTESLAPESSSGRMVLQYQILAKLGEGGMGQVFQARDLKLDRLVALKFLAPHLLDSEAARTRFLSEARALSTLNHPHIATIFDADEVDGSPFLVLEYLPGGTLRSKVLQSTGSGSSLAVPEILNYAIGIAAGLAHAHRHHIIHRDVKTGNILLNAEGIVKVTDFGLARFRGEAHVTGPGRAVGTAAYMSPEQVEGKEIDHRSDIFSFGVVLYELATGSLPFRGDDWPALLYQILNSDPPSISALRPDLPLDLQTVVERALRKDPDLRFQRMEDMVESLTAVRRQVESGDGSASNRQKSSGTAALLTGGLSLRWVAAVIALAVLIGSAGLIPAVRTRISHILPTSGLHQEKHLAVLPFVNIGSDPGAQAFCDGLVESLTSNLTQLEHFQNQLRVVPASEVRRQSITSVQDAQKSFAVNLAVTGSIQRTGDNIRITVNLSDARSLVQLAARTLDVRYEALATVQDRLVDVVAALLDVQLQPQARQTVTAGGTTVPDAYDAYLQGRGYLRRFDKPGNLEASIAGFQKALERDSHYALAYAGLGEAYRRSFDRTKDTQWLEQSQLACLRAIELNSRLPAAHVSLGMVYSQTGRHGMAVSEFKKALDLDPISADAYRELGGAYEAQNKIEDAEATYKQAIRLRDGDWIAHGLLGTFYYRRGRYRDAEAPLKKVIELTPDNFNGYYLLGGLYIVMARYAEAEANLKQSVAVKETDRGYSNLGSLYYTLGRYADAVGMFEKAVELGAGSSSVVLGNLADAYLWVPGQEEKAVPVYRRAIELAERQLAVNPKDALVLSRLAGYRAHSGLKAQALADIAKARKLAPHDTTIEFKAILVNEIAGKRGAALKALEAALKNGYSFAQVEREPELQKLRLDPAYQKLVTRVRTETNSGNQHK